MRSNPGLLLVTVWAASLVVAGCSKKESNATTGVEAQAIALAPDAAANPAPTQADQEVPFQVRDLQLSVEAYQKVTGKKPTSLAQLVQDGFLNALPPAPPGKRYSLDPATSRVSLVPQ